MAFTKEVLRRTLLKRRQDQNFTERRKRDEGIRRNLVGLEEFKSANRVLMFYPTKGEPDITPVLELVLREGKQLVLPRVERGDIRLLRVRSLGELAKGSFGIPEPIDGEEVSPKSLDLVVVPGVAFDRCGYRVGFGGGFYDRLLPRVRCLKVGVAYSFQLLERVPRDPWDVPVDIVVTEEEVVRWRSSRC